MSNTSSLCWGIMLALSMLCIIPANGDCSGIVKDSVINELYLNMDIVFEDDKKLDQTVKEIILTDYKSVLQWLEPKGTYEVFPRMLQINDTVLNITNVLDFNTESEEIAPFGYENQFGVIGHNADGQKFFVLTRRLSDGYKTAIEFMRKHKSAFQSLSEFLALINLMDEANLPSVDQLMYFYGTGAEEYNAEMQRTASSNHEDREKYIAKFVREFGGARYALGSILEYQILDKRPVVTIHRLDADTEKRTVRMHLIYDKERWKMLINTF